MKNLCFSGHRTEKLPKDLDFLKECIKIECQKAINEGYTNFYQGACYGFDLICAEVILELKKDFENIKLFSVVPYKEQYKYWDIKIQEQYFEILEQSDEVIEICDTFRRGCFHERNRYMVDRSQKLICYCNEKVGGTKFTINYAIKNNLDCVNLACSYNFK